jgi:pimeloyl-ACP methyl ester carboxylesterase
MPVLRIADTNLHYEMGGQGRSILFIHGLGSSALDWEEQVSFFSKQFQVITYDVRGHGRSDIPAGPYTIPLFAQDAAMLLKALERKEAHVVGISMGGMIAFELALEKPDLVSSLTIVNSRPDPRVTSTGEQVRLFLRVLAVRLLGMRRIAQIHSKRLFPGSKHQALRRAFVERRAGNSKRAYLDSLRAITAWSVAEKLASITCPTLVIAGERDYRPVSEKASFTEQIPSAELVVIPDSRHATPLERPELFNQTLLRFLSRKEERDEG